MDDGHLWLVLFIASLCVNIVQLLWRPILNLLHRKDQVSEDNIMAMVEEGEESGAIQGSEKEFIENVLEFDNITAKDVMVHRTDMVSLPADAEESEILDAIRQSGLSRFPVYGEDVDDIVGILSTREYLLNFREENPKPLKDLLRPAYFVPETVAADVLFRDMQGKKTHLALVVDEYGGTSGLVTLEDLLEELVGNIYDEFDPAEEKDIEPAGPGVWKVSGSCPLEQVSEALGVEFPQEEESDTLGGLVFAQLSVIPEDGAQIEVDAHGLHIEVLGFADRRVEWALVSKRSPAPENESDV